MIYTNPNDLVELRFSGDRAVLDSNGERSFTSAELYSFALRCIDAAALISGVCPLKPFADQLVVHIIEESNRVSGGGIHIPDNTFDVAFRGVVLEVGPMVAADKRWIEPPQVGDIITFSRNAGIVITVGDTAYLTMKAVYALDKVQLPTEVPDVSGNAAEAR